MNPVTTIVCCRTATPGSLSSVTTRTLTPAVAALAADISAVVHSNRRPADVARAVASAVERALPTPGLLAAEHQRASTECYRQHLLYVDPDGAFSIVALVWLPGQRTPIHDHISWCVVGVHEGGEEETLYSLVDGAYLVRTGHAVNREGTVSWFVPPGDIHEVANTTGQRVISIHVYGAD